MFHTCTINTVVSSYNPKPYNSCMFTSLSWMATIMYASTVGC